MYPQPVASPADLANAAQRRIEDLFARQFRSFLVFAGITALLSSGIILATVLFFRSSPDETAIRQLKESNSRSAAVTQALVDAAAGRAAPEAVTEALRLVVSESAVRAQGLESLQQSEEGLSSSVTLVLQIIGGGVLLALIGYLGLNRLQNIDAELQRLREFMFEQIRDRTAEQRELVTAGVTQELTSTLVAVDTAKSALTEIAERVQSELQSTVKSIEERYSFLTDATLRRPADQIASISSVRQAEQIAEELRLGKEYDLAKRALELIASKSLVGSADDFHNAHVEANRLQDGELAERITRRGLELYSANFDLIGDIVSALSDVGKLDEGLQILDRWRESSPSEFTRGWRPVVFYANAIASVSLTTERIERVRAAFTTFLEARPEDYHAWMNWANFETDAGNRSGAKDTLERGLKISPFSQTLNFQLGKMLLADGAVDDAVARIEQALRVDLQSSFQSDLPQGSLYLTLGQAYEAANKPARAQAAYAALLQLAKDGGVPSMEVQSPRMVDYARHRLLAMAVADSEGSTSEED